MLGMGKIVLSVIVGVLILSTTGFTDLFAEIVVANFTAYVGPTESIAADSGTPFPAAITVFDPSILGGEMELVVNYNGGPGTTVASIDAGGSGLTWTVDAGTNGLMGVILTGPAGVGLGVDLSGEDAITLEYASNPFSHDIQFALFDSFDTGAIVDVSVDAGQSSVTILLSSLIPLDTSFPDVLPDFSDVDELEFLFFGVGGSTMEITSIGTSVLLVGGTSIPIDTTSLLLAGASVNVWMIPVVLSAAGFGILIARKI